MKNLHNVFSTLTEDSNLHGYYTPKAARC